MNEYEELYTVWLSLKTVQCNPRMGELINKLGGVKKVYEADEATYLSTNLVKKNELSGLLDKSLASAEDLLERCRKETIQAVPLGSEQYPELLSKIFNPPLVLFVRGNPDCLSNRLLLSMVGTRRCSEYGANVAEMLSHGLASSGAVIVSGMALGIDSYAHKGALTAEGETVAVLGTGLDVIYPEENKKLYEKIVEKGAVVSEYPFGTRALKENFPARNRIIAGLSAGTIVVEAPEKSGALITARLALDEGRDLFAVPGNIYFARGTNQLLKECAKLVTEPKDVLEEYANNFYDRIEHAVLASKKIGKEIREQSGGPQFQIEETGEEPSKERQDELASDTDLTEIEKKVKSVLTKQPKYTDEIIREVGLTASQTCAALTMLELKKHIHSLPGGRYYRE